MIGSNRDEPALFMVQDPKYVRTLLGVFNSLKNKGRLPQTGVSTVGLQWKARGSRLHCGTDDPMQGNEKCVCISIRLGTKSQQ